MDAVFESRERLRTLVADLATLSERQRSALVMRELSGLSHEQIAAALGTSSGAARQVVYEARQALLELEEGRGMECERVRMALSDGDGRRLRGRGVRAHLRGCQGCRDFQAGIEAACGRLRTARAAARRGSGVGRARDASCGGGSAGGGRGRPCRERGRGRPAERQGACRRRRERRGRRRRGHASAASTFRAWAVPASPRPSPGVRQPRPPTIRTRVKRQTASDPVSAGADARHEGPQSAGKQRAQAERERPAG